MAYGPGPHTDIIMMQKGRQSSGLPKIQRILNQKMMNSQLPRESYGTGRPPGRLTGCAAVNLIDLSPIQRIGSQHATVGELPTRARTLILFCLGATFAILRTVLPFFLPLLYRVEVSTRL